jgi:hypothetical protein
MSSFIVLIVLKRSPVFVNAIPHLLRSVNHVGPRHYGNPFPVELNLAVPDRVDYSNVGSDNIRVVGLAF